MENDHRLPTSDIRSTSKAYLRAKKHAAKYYHNAHIKRGQLGQPHYIGDTRRFNTYPADFSDAPVVTLTKRQHYTMAQEWPRPPRKHKSDRRQRVMCWSGNTHTGRWGGNKNMWLADREVRAYEREETPLEDWYMELELSNDFCMQYWDNFRWEKDYGEESLNYRNAVGLGDFVDDETWRRMEERDWRWEDWHIKREWDVVKREDGEEQYEEDYWDLLDDGGEEEWEKL
ncbi:hypothetical protein LTS18_007405 [Coniosporium uncinatum]|uniref:Uncharacterized protein n=1 Tax=Coniosporium uncinatum TaxID=93489 RepID=A0ACC3DXY2_9PEZI|nr:hypothetical protein LTS18_007405 [Coniosporium uncinatum]